MTEAELKVVVINMALEHGWYVYTTAQAKPRRPPRLKTAAGYPDDTLARAGEVMWIETKDEKGELTEQQKIWQGLLKTKVIRPMDIELGYLLELLK